MSVKKKVVFLGSKPIGTKCLQYLIAQQAKLNYEIVAIGTKDRTEFASNNPIRDLAATHAIPILQHPDEIPACDIIYSVQYHAILKIQHINKATQIALNLHLAPLPDYRGCNQFSFAIFDGAATFGVTIHAIDEGVDSGDILFENRFPLDAHIWVNDLYNKAVHCGQQLFENTLPAVITGNYNRQAQGALIASRGIHIHKRKDIDDLKIIRLDEPQAKTMRRIRATYMPGFESPYFVMDGKKVSISIP